ncbi:MAG TPA: FHA domain-containing protein [Myxococcota bacterium]|nr:FHA domain-containing protein [Myxococcota bacterium]
MSADRRRRRPPPLPADDEGTQEIPDNFPTDEIPAVGYDGPGDADVDDLDAETSEMDSSPIRRELARRGLRDIEDEEEIDEGEVEKPTELVDPEDLSDPGLDQGAFVFGGEEPEDDDAGPTFVGSLPDVQEPQVDDVAEKTEILAAVPDEAPDEVPLLTVETPDGASDVEVSRDMFVIGRAPECDVVLPDQLVSRKHARIEKRADGWYVVDLDSGNGTFLNDERVSESLLYNGDLIQVGDAAISFAAPGSDSSRPGGAPVEKTMMLAASDVESLTSAGPIPKSPRRKKLFVVIGCLIVLIGILGIAKVLTKNKGPTPEQLAAQRRMEEQRLQAERVQQAQATFGKVRDLVKQEKWVEAKALIVEVAQVLDDDKLVAKYRQTIEREDSASRAILDAEAKVTLSDFDAAILLLNTVSPDSLQVDKAKELKTQVEKKRQDYKLEEARKALDGKEFEKAMQLADEVLLASPDSEVAQELKHAAEKLLNKPPPHKGGKKKKKKRKKIVRPQQRSKALLVGACLDAFRNGKIDAALSQAAASGVSSEGVNQLRKFQKLYKRGTELARNSGQAAKAEAFLVQALKLNEMLGGKKDKLSADLHSKLAKVYFVKGVDAQNSKKYPLAFKSYKSALEHKPGLNQAQKRLDTLEREARKLYEMAYVIKGTQPDRAVSTCKTVMQMTNSGAYAYGRCKKLLHSLREPGSSGDDDSF